MTAPTLRCAVRTDLPVPEWQARCVDLLAAVPGVVLVGPDDSAAATVDVVLDLTAGTPPPVQRAAETWSFRHGAGASRDFDRTALEDYVRGPGVTRTALVSDPSGAIVREGWPRSAVWSRRPALEARLIELAEWPAYAARDRLAGRTSPPVAGADDRRARGDPVPALVRGRLGAVPRPILVLGAAARRVEEVAVSLTRHPDWNVGIMPEPIDGMVRSRGGRTIEWLPARPDAWVADPFGIERGGVLHLFFEDFSRNLNRGVISYASVSRDGIVSAPECVLDVGVHASYPFLIERDGTVFILPETSAAGELVLYEAVEFPRRWRRAATLLPGVPAVDASVVEHEGRWWMFAGIFGRGQNHTLFAWHAPDLMGPWTEHAANPVKTDARSTRGGGTPFVVDGTLYRPSQDCSRTYGGRLVLNRVELLSPSAFRERPIRALAPRAGSPYPEGLHTLSAAGTRTLVDGYGRRFVREDMQRLLEYKQRQVMAKLGF